MDSQDASVNEREESIEGEVLVVVSIHSNRIKHEIRPTNEGNTVN